MTIPQTAYGAQVVANQAKALVIANWSTVCDGCMADGDGRAWLARTRGR